MAYCTQADIERHITAAELVKLADHDQDGAADADVVTQAIENASGTIDSYLAVKFIVPVSPVPNEIRRLAMLLAVCEMQTGRRGLSEDHKAICKEAMGELQKIADGKKSVGLLPLPTESAGAPGVRFSGQDRVFGRDEPL